MTKKKLNTIMLCRAGLIAALYAVLTFAFGPLAFGPVQIRPAEALTILPLFFVESIPGLYVGCMLANLVSGYGLYDIFLGSLATLLAAVCTYAAGRLIKNDVLKVIVGGFFPVVFNAFAIPAIIILAGDSISYWATVGSMAITQAIWIYAIGAPLYYSVKALRAKGVRALSSYPYKAELKKSEKNKSNGKELVNSGN